MAKHKVHVEGMIYVFNVDESTNKFITTTLKPEVSGIADDNSILYITTIADDEEKGYRFWIITEKTINSLGL